MRAKINVFLAVGLVFVLISTASATNFSTKPALNKGQKWRMGYLEGGHFPPYKKNFLGYIYALSDLGWLEEPNIPSQIIEADDRDLSKIWEWLSKNLKSNYIEFVIDGFYTDNWDKDLRVKNKEIVIKRLKEIKDIDFMIAMGTWAGQDLANNEHNTTVMVFSTSDPIKAGIIKSVEDSGYDHVHARVDPERYERQVRLFHEIIGFQKLGVAYEDSPSGRTYAAITDIEKVGKEKGFEVIPCYTQNQVPDFNVALQSVIKCHEELATKVDAVYITTQTGVNNLKYMPQVLEPLNRHKIPTFSQVGSEHVVHGVLLCIAQAGFKYVAQFHAEITAKIFNGAKPRELPQLFADPPKIAINLATAEIIEYDPPVDILGAADEIYQEIEVAK
ncbi:MAG: ABC transporter substrate-binding protein [Desulfobacterales bacterium]|nr:ABC transporter substrate-binding protein [Desulfobacterales bacterium]